MLKEYLDYLKDNPRGYWFKAKLYGWGWTPARWQGWAVLFATIFVVIWDFNRIDSRSHSASDTLINFIPQVFLITLVLIAICYKTGEKPRWRWGMPKKKDD